MRKDISLVGIALTTIRVHENHSLHVCVWFSLGFTVWQKESLPFQWEAISTNRTLRLPVEL
jgi:hypothetical protein